MKKDRFIRIIKYIINIPVWLLSKFIQPNKNIWVFGAWFGKKYGDNSKYLFEYVNKNCPNVTAIWLTKDNKTLDLVRKKGFKAYKTYSFMGYIYSALAEYGFVSTGYEDINIFPTYHMKIINLWHGADALKKVCMDDNMTRHTTLYYKLKRIFFPFTYNGYYSCIANSECNEKILKSAFRTLTKRVDLIGQPRCDVFYTDSPRLEFNLKIENFRNQGNIIGIYMPTHRREGKLNFSEFLINELSKLNDVLNKNNVVLLIKLHYYHLQEINNINVNYSNIIFVKDNDIEQDIYTIMNNIDFLITDYSGIYVDYLHTKKPIIFFPFDKDDYLKNDRELYMDYDEATPGKKVYSWEELYDAISMIANGKYNYTNEIIAANNLFNKYQDGKNSERVVEWIKTIK